MAIHREGDLERKSVPLYGRTSLAAEDEETGHYVFMLEQDIADGLIPIGGRIRRTRQPCIRLVSGEQEAPRELAASIANAISSSDRGSLAPAVAQWVRQTAASMTVYGSAMYEIAYYRRDGALVGFIVLHLDPRVIRRRRGEFIQEIPPGTRIPGETLADEPREIPERERPLDASSLLIVDWPPNYGRGPDVVRELMWLGRMQHPKFLIPRSEGSQVPYDFDRFREAQDQALAASTRILGWNGRGSFERGQTGYYYLVRHLRFEEFKIILRDHIIDHLNEALERAGNCVGFKARVLLQGLPTLADIAEAKELLGAAKMTPKELVDRFSIY
jgi:hypothetical protein